MSKLTYEDKLNIYNERKNGKTRIYLSKKYSIGKDKIDYLTRLIDKHGFDILRTTKNRTYTKCEKERIVNRVLLNGETVLSVSLDEGLLSNGILFNWIKDYKEMGYNIVERKRGRSPTMSKKPKITNKLSKNPTIVNGIAGILITVSPKLRVNVPIVPINSPAEKKSEIEPRIMRATW